MIGEKGGNCIILRNNIKQAINKDVENPCGNVFIQMEDNQLSDEDFFEYDEIFDGGGHELWMYITIGNCGKKFKLVMDTIKEFMSELFDDEEEDDESEDEYASYNKNDNW